MAGLDHKFGSWRSCHNTPINLRPGYLAKRMSLVILSLGFEAHPRKKKTFLMLVGSQVKLKRTWMLTLFQPSRNICTELRSYFRRRNLHLHTCSSLWPRETDSFPDITWCLMTSSREKYRLSSQFWCCSQPLPMLQCWIFLLFFDLNTKRLGLIHVDPDMRIKMKPFADTLLLQQVKTQSEGDVWVKQCKQL